MNANNQNWAANMATNLPLDQLLASLAQATPTAALPQQGSSGLPQLHVGRPTRYANLQWFPVWTAAPIEPRGYATEFNVAEVKIAERDQATVGALKIENSTEKPVLLFEGTLLEGGWQHRALTRSVLVPAASVIDLPVVCVEHGRWGGTAHQVIGKKMATAGMRASMRGIRKQGSTVMQSEANQGEVWSKVDQLAFALGQHAPTQSYVEMRNALDENMQLQKVTALPAQRGVIIAIGGHPVALELFDHPDTLAERIDSIVQSYAAESMLKPFIATHSSRVRSFVERIEKESVDDVIDENRKRTRANAHIATEALFEREQLLHLSTLNVKHELVLAA